MKKETKAKAKTKAATTTKGKKAAESKPKAKAKKDAAKDMKLAEKYEAVTELFFKNEASAIIEKLKDFPFKSELYFKKKGNPAPVVYAAADVVFTGTEQVEVCKGKEYGCVLKLENGFTNLVNENKRREEYVEEHEVKFVAEEGKMTCDDDECSEITFVFKMRQLFPALL